MNADMCLNTLEAVRTKSKMAQLKVCLDANSLLTSPHLISSHADVEPDELKCCRITDHFYFFRRNLWAYDRGYDRPVAFYVCFFKCMPSARVGSQGPVEFGMVQGIARPKKRAHYVDIQLRSVTSPVP